jgi:hypothetical protein
VLACALVAVLLAACAQSDDDPNVDPGSPSSSGPFVGTLAGTTAMVGLVRDGDQLAAYVCGREDTLASHTRWFNGALENDGDTFNLDVDEATFTLNGDDWSLSGAITADGVSGTLVDPDGTSSSFVLEVAAAGSLSGLYSVLDGDCRSGLIVSDPGATGTLITQGAWCDGSGLIKQVTPMSPVTLTDDGALQVTVDEADPENLLMLSPHTP